MTTSWLQEKLRKEIFPQLMKEFNYKSSAQLPKLVKVTVNIGLGEAVANPKVMDGAIKELTKIVGQKPKITKAKKSIAAFKLRADMQIGLMATLRRQRMWHFMERLMSVALPQVRDFRGLPRRSFDGHGNYTLGIREQIIFPEINYDDIEIVRGMNISLHTSAKSDEEALRMLELLGMPFKKK